MSKITIDRDVLEQVLEALDNLYLPGELQRVNAAIKALKQVLTEPKPGRKPVELTDAEIADVIGHCAMQADPESMSLEQWRVFVSRAVIAAYEAKNGITGETK